MERKADQVANDHYKHCYGTERVYKIFDEIVITDGVKEVAEKEECYWFLDVICSYQYQNEVKETFCQEWKLQRIEGYQFLITATNIETGKIIVTQKIEFSDFFFKELTMLKHNTVILLPSED